MAALPAKSQTQAYLQNHIDECYQLADQARTEVEKLQEAPEAERRAIVANAFTILKDAEENLKSLQYGSRAATGEQRQILQDREQDVRGELQAVAKELEDLKRQYLLGDGKDQDTEKFFKARDDRRRAEAITGTMRTANDRLAAARKAAIEAEESSIDTLRELQRQGEVINRVQAKTADVSQNVKESQQAVKSLEQNNCMVM
eukprot:CAMPEP_0117502866 /NCGR_PEP_ID=MMETSP0784-20121206/24032_1 /TAXON_ID=39447 /ORGANISM="" /LENGTH=201 /DNA_ID=CAMNT_0005298159 /DNA_START=113 /DNA_END=718 /DNA_ORIENTATION=+